MNEQHQLFNKEKKKWQVMWKVNIVCANECGVIKEKSWRKYGLVVVECLELNFVAH